MNRTPLFSPHSVRLTGVATVAADDLLTIHSASDGFASLFSRTPASIQKASFRSLLSSLSADGLRAAVMAGKPFWEGQIALNRSSASMELHLSATRIEAPNGDKKSALYHLVLTDLSDLMEMRRSAALEKKKYEIIADLTEDIPFEYDFASDVMTCAEKFRNVFGREPVIRRFRSMYAKGALPGGLVDAFQVLLDAKGMPPNAPLEYRAVTTQGALCWFSCFWNRLTDERGRTTKVVGAIRDIDRQKREQLSLLDKSRTDAMTGLLNKATTEEEIREALTAVSSESMGALMMLDLDNFKHVNDSMGHQAGDEVLIQLGRLLLRTFRGDDIIGRVGGDEFHVFMRGVHDTASACERAQEICSAGRKLFTASFPNCSVSVSIGIAYADEAIPYADLFRRADVALYRAKANGKNRYEVFGQAGESGEQRGSVSGNPGSLVGRVARNSIVAEIIDTLFGARDMRQGIDNALDFIGNTLRVDSILIYEKSLDFKMISLTHEWAAKDEWKKGVPGRDVPAESLRLPRPSTPGGIYYCSDLAELPPDERTFDIDPAVTSLLQCDILREGMVAGTICFEERGHKRIWTQQEIDVLILLSKLLGGHIRQKQASSLLRRSHAATRDILNSLPGTYVFVIAKASYRLLYFNSKVQTQFPRARIGMTCHDLFHNSPTPCADCHQCRVSEGGTYSTILHDVPFGKTVRYSISELLWDNREAAYASLISEFLPQEEQEQNRKKEAYVLSLCAGYDYVFDIDPSTGQYEMLALSDVSRKSFPGSGAYNLVLRSIVDARIRQEDRENFWKHFRLEGLTEAFDAGAPSVELEYGWQDENGRLFWKDRLALPNRHADGSFRILTYVRDITVQKEQELRRRQEEADYLLALQSNYSEIFRIDLKKKKILPVYYDNKQVSIQADTADFTTFVRERAKNRVHPESRAAVMSFYDPDRIRDCLEKGIPQELEYRKKQEEDGAYRWYMATLRPVPGDPAVALLLLRDATRSREEEANFYAALRSGYAEIYEMDLDLDTVRPITTSPDLPVGLLTLDYSQDSQDIAETRVHPDDKAAFEDLYKPENLRRRLKEGKDLSLDYRRKGKDGRYLTVSSLILPLSGATCKVLVLGRNITAQKSMEEANRRLERRHNAVFRQSWDAMVEVNLHTAEYRQTSFSSGVPLPAQYNDYGQGLQDILESVHPEDRDVVSQTRSLEALRTAFEAGEALHSCQIRMRVDGVWVWMESRVVFLAEEGDPTAFILSRGITFQKKFEEERNRDAQRLNIALRDTYAEMYEFDIESNVSTLIFSNNAFLSPVGTGDLVKSDDIIKQALHPADQQSVAAFFDQGFLQNSFEQGKPEVSIEFRRLGVDGTYYWVSGTIVPLRDAHGVITKSMVLVKDISARKGQEQRERVMAQYNLALRNIYDELYECNVTRGICHFVHHAGGKYIPPPENETPGKMIRFLADELIHPDDSQAFLRFFNFTEARIQLAGNREFLIGEFRRLGTDNGFHWVSFTMFPVDSGLEREELYLICVLDIDTHKRSEAIAQQNTLLERQREADERYRLIVEQTNTLVFEWGEKGTCYLSTELPQRFSGDYDERQLLHIWEQDKVVHPDDMSAFENFLKECHFEQHAEMTVRLRLRDGDFAWCKVAVSCLNTKDGRRCIGTLNDVHEATRSALDLRYRAEFDVLTGISNMQTFYARAEYLLRENPDKQYFVIRMDIDRFKVINDLYGMEEGDKLLRTIAQLLLKRIGEHGVCGRISGDVFCACVDYTREQVVDFIAGVRQDLNDYPLSTRIVLSFGVCDVENVETPMNMLCDWANLALKTVKGNVLLGHAFYDETLRVRILEEKKIENEMHEALALGQFELYLQPKVHIPTSKITGAEGLVRWRHPSEGLIPPDRFIPLFERNGFIIHMDEYIWEQACKLLRSWLDRGLSPLPISVNVSRMHIHDTRLCDKLPALLAKYDLPPHFLELELTENVFLDSENQLFETIGELRRHGFHFSLDDFGSGYSSLNVLKSLPVETIKIDRGFLNEIVATPRGKTIIRHIISLAKDLSMQITAEGVENEEQAAFLVTAGCMHTQGFYYSQPVPCLAFEALAFTSACPFPRIFLP